jgi:hypothetical protein
MVRRRVEVQTDTGTPLSLKVCTQGKEEGEDREREVVWCGVKYLAP